MQNKKKKLQLNYNYNYKYKDNYKRSWNQENSMAKKKSWKNHLKKITMNYNDYNNNNDNNYNDYNDWQATQATPTKEFYHFW